jgi:hypothetical protein
MGSSFELLALPSTEAWMDHAAEADSATEDRGSRDFCYFRMPRPVYSGMWQIHP